MTTEERSRRSGGRSGGGRGDGGGRSEGGRGPRRGGRSGSGAKPKKDYGPVEELHPIDTPPDIESFEEWPLADFVQKAIKDMGITKPTPIQALSIGAVYEGRDVIAKAETGTGKTLAFGAPMMSRVDAGRSTVLGLALCPTRELAQQVAEVLEKLGESEGIQVALLVGGEPIGPQINQLKAGAQVIVGTPGRVLDLMGQKFLSFPWTEFVVLDEADEMLEIGFLDDVEKILLQTPEERQTLLFSATFPPALLALARKHTKNPAEIATARGVSAADTIRQSVVFCSSEDDRAELLRTLIRRSGKDELLLAFGERRTDVDRMLRRLERLPEGVKALHGGYDQTARFRVMSAFRDGSIRALVATDVASRGLDVRGVTHVINCGVPREVSSYTHRIGRTGRAGSEGHAITLVAPGDMRRWRELVGQMAWDVEELDARDLVASMGGGAPRTRAARERDEAREAGERPRRRREGADDERPARRERGARDERPARRERSDRDERPARRERSDRDERPAREDRPARSERSDRDERPARRERSDRDERPAREDRPARSERSDRDERPARRERSDRDERPAREDRPARRERSDRDERPARSHRDERPDDQERPRRSRTEDAPERAPRAAAGDGRRDRSAPESRRRDRDDERPARAPRERSDRDERPRRRDEGERSTERSRERTDRGDSARPRSNDGAPAFGAISTEREEPRDEAPARRPRRDSAEPKRERPARPSKEKRSDAPANDADSFGAGL
ncbi:putative DEAD-box ATP-dependent RNA helicase [Planctomycetes bacterium Pla163]|uniref:Putative DEAD-box ATP-dependent RNA helicase n=1 Tax=Rohdeia mirabilis TaxID=2528008 RepID=A0A518CYD0_9BACT|nr:putative DEAD-box ATP-dependent RNA helicase [Planctomycetes bacterium Pla163]